MQEHEWEQEKEDWQEPDQTIAEAATLAWVQYRAWAGAVAAALQTREMAHRQSASQIPLAEADAAEVGAAASEAERLEPC